MSGQKIYRNIIITGSHPTFRGKEDVYYCGNLITNAQFIKNLKIDQDQDLVIVCGTCAAKKYRNFIKVSR